MVLKVLNSPVRLNKTVLTFSVTIVMLSSIHSGIRVVTSSLGYSGNEGADFAGSDPALHLSYLLLVSPHQQSRLATHT